jgi:hypothetical protein
MNNKKILYRKIGGGSLRIRLDGKRQIIKPWQKFLAFPEEIPAAFKDVIVPQEDVAEFLKPEKQIPKIEITSETRKKGFFHIVDKEGKKLNEKALMEEEANQFLKDLNGE